MAHEVYSRYTGSEKYPSDTGPVLHLIGNKLFGIANLLQLRNADKVLVFMKYKLLDLLETAKKD